MTAKAGMYGPEAIITSAGVPIKNTAVTVYKHGTTTTATLYSSPTMTGTIANPVDTDGRGNLTFYAAPGEYDLSVDITGVATSYSVQVEPWTGTLAEALEGYLPLFGVGNALYGAAAASGALAFLVQAGITTVNVQKSNFSFYLPEPFPAATLVCFVQVLMGPLGGGGESDVVKIMKTTAGVANNHEITGQIMRMDATYTGSMDIQYLAIGC